MNCREVVDLMTSATSEKDWNSKCNQVKDACEGYPSFWFSSIILSGLADRVRTSW